MGGTRGRGLRGLQRHLTLQEVGRARSARSVRVVKHRVRFVVLVRALWVVGFSRLGGVSGEVGCCVESVGSHTVCCLRWRVHPMLRGLCYLVWGIVLSRHPRFSVGSLALPTFAGLSCCSSSSSLLAYPTRALIL